MAKEKSIEQIVAELKKDKDFADLPEEELIEMAEMELAESKNKHYTDTEKSKEKGKREIKPDETKVKMISAIAECLKDTNFECLTIKNVQREITFVYGNENYSLTLTKHRGNHPCK